jgi:CSLREA domain-containing protein/uncharacterized repeat protein (TIGR01451 family)
MGAGGVLGLALAAALATGLVGAEPALADVTFNVTTTSDLPAANPVNGCATAGGPCSLRSAIQAADALPSGSGNVTINVPPGSYALTIPPAGSDDASTGDLNITYGSGRVTVAGAGASSNVLDARAIDRAFDISSTAQVTISGLTIKNGNPDPSELNDGTTCPASEPSNTAAGGAILTAGALTLSGDVITGSISAGDGGGVEDSGTAPVTISDSQITDNVACAAQFVYQTVSIGFGGGVDESGGGPLTIDHSTVSANQAAADGGGVIENSQMASQPGSVTVTDSTLDGNSSTGGDGGAVSSEGTNGSISGTVALSRDTISANSASGFGGGVSSRDPLTVTDSTLIGNTAGREGGGLASTGASATVSFSTLDANSASGGGGGGDLSTGGEQGQVSVDDSIVTAGTAAGAPSLCSFGVTSGGHNLFSDDGSSCATAAGDGDILNADPQLGPLQDNGGPTQTQALKSSSPAIDAASSSLCSNETANAAGQPVDQRGVSRPQGSACDIGAYEYGGADLALSASSSPASIQTSGSSTLTERVTNAGPTPATDVGLTATIPAGLQAGTPTASQGSCTVSSGTVSCALGAVSPGASGVTVSIPLSATTDGRYSLPASVTLDQSDATPADNQATANLTVSGQSPSQPASSGIPGPAPVILPVSPPAPPGVNPTPVNQPLSGPVPPIANPVATRLGRKYSRRFRLDGTASSDPNKGGRIVSYQWSSDGRIVSRKATFVYRLAPGVKQQSFTLKVVSSENLSATGRVRVSPLVAPVIKITVDTVHFCENCYDLSRSAISIIDRVRHYLRGARFVKLVASCDKYASVAYNVWLAEERDLAVKHRLLIGRYRHLRTYLVILGKTHPLRGVNQDTPLGRYLNRRVTIIITP